MMLFQEKLAFGLHRYYQLSLHAAHGLPARRLIRQAAARSCCRSPPAGRAQLPSALRQRWFEQPGAIFTSRIPAGHHVSPSPEQRQSISTDYIEQMTELQRDILSRLCTARVIYSDPGLINGIFGRQQLITC